jgi:hypothetical protein
MRFTLVKNLQQDPLMKPILSGLLIFIFIYLVSDLIVKNFSFGIFVQDIKNTLFGNEDQFIDPITKGDFLEFWHVEIFFIMMILLTLNAIYIRVAKNSKLFLHLLMSLALISLFSLLISYFISDSFVYIYTFSFFAWHICAMYISLYSLWRLNLAKNI